MKYLLCQLFKKEIVSWCSSLISFLSLISADASITFQLPTQKERKMLKSDIFLLCCYIFLTNQLFKKQLTSWCYWSLISFLRVTLSDATITSQLPSKRWHMLRRDKYFICCYIFLSNQLQLTSWCHNHLTITPTKSEKKMLKSVILLICCDKWWPQNITAGISIKHFHFHITKYIEKEHSGTTASKSSHSIAKIPITWDNKNIYIK